MSLLNAYAEQLAMGRIHATSKRFKERLQFAQSGIEAMFAVAPTSYVSLSFGKQSICVAHLVYKIAPTTPMYFLASGETWDMFDYRQVIDEFLAICPVNLTIVQTEHFYSQKHTTWKDSRDAGDKDLQKMCDRAKWDGWFWGLSVEESPIRRKTLLQYNPGKKIHPSIFEYADGKYRCCPIMMWGIKDLAAYLGTHNLPVLNLYKKFGLDMRSTARITKKAKDRDGLAWIKIMSQAGFYKMSEKYEDLK